MSSARGLLPVPVVPGDLISGRYAETAVMPGHEFFDRPIAYSAFSLEHGQDLGAEDLFQLLQVPFGQEIKGAVRSKQPIGDDGMEMGVKSGVIPEVWITMIIPSMPSLRPSTVRKNIRRLSLAQWQSLVRSFRSYLK